MIRELIEPETGRQFRLDIPPQPDQGIDTKIINQQRVDHLMKAPFSYRHFIFRRIK